MRNETRQERYKRKNKTAKTYPIYLATINFVHDVNVAFALRSAVCFGLKELLILGNHPDKRLMNELSGSTFDQIKTRTFNQPHALLNFLENKNIQPICLELPNEICKSVSIHDFKFNFNRPICLIAGHETYGIPNEILFRSKAVYIPINGSGYCLNTAQAATVAMYETVKQFDQNALKEQKCQKKNYFSMANI